MAGPDFDTEIKQLLATMSTIGQVLDLDGMRREIADLGEQVAAPDLWDDQANATRVTGRLSGLQGELDRFSDLESRIGDLGALVELGQEEDDAASMAEAEAELTKIKKSVEALEVRTLLSGEYDARDAVITVRSGAGGVDAADFTEMLMRMYVRWAEQHKYPVEVFDTSYAEEAGLKSATFAIHAPYAYGTLSVEAGTHRLVRISPFDNQGRRQTSFAAVEVVPVLEQTDEIEIPDEDIRVDVYRSSGPGGQSVNTTDSAVRLTHIPTGTVVSCQNEKSQLQNKASAMVILKAKLLVMKKAEEAAELKELKGDVPGDVGRPDAQLRAEPLPDGQGPAHRLRGRQPAGRLRRRHRRLHRGRHPLAAWRRAGRRELSGLGHARVAWPVRMLPWFGSWRSPVAVHHRGPQPLAARPAGAPGRRAGRARPRASFARLALSRGSSSMFFPYARVSVHPSPSDGPQFCLDPDTVPIRGEVHDTRCSLVEGGRQARLETRNHGSLVEVRGAPATSLETPQPPPRPVTGFESGPSRNPSTFIENPCGEGVLS